MSKEAYCLWHDKFLVDVAEYEAEGCSEYCLNCDECESFAFVERVVWDEF